MAMRQEPFQRERETRWRAFEKTLDALETGGDPPEDFGRAYRAICQDTALARERGFGAGLVSRLERLTVRGHAVLYGTQAGGRRRALETLLEFPRALRQEWRLLLLTALLFYGTGMASYVAVRADPDVVYTVLGGSQAATMEQMYDPDSDHMGIANPPSGKLEMFGVYISNNVGIGFRCFASGIFFGIGSIFVLLFNGVVLGGVAGHLMNVGYGETFWPFVIGHGAFELNAILVCGMCGLRLGLSVTVPGRRRRVDSLRTAARGVLPLLYGGTVMLFIAAIIEAFWSANHDVWPHSLMYTVGAALWLLVVGTLSLAGRRHAD